MVMLDSMRGRPPLDCALDYRLVLQRVRPGLLIVPLTWFRKPFSEIPPPADGPGSGTVG